MFGSVAVVQAKVNKEKIHDGKNISGESFLWISSRSAQANGVVRSSGAKVS